MQFEKYVDRQILKEIGQNVYRLRRPVQITVRKRVIDTLKVIYPLSFEKGGILEAEIAGNAALVINTFHEVGNTTDTAYHYNPDVAVWNNTLVEILRRGNLPIALHTHPRKLGIESYDNNKSIHFLRSSKSDRIIAREGITRELRLPEAIFTKDPNLEHGFGLVFYAGYIFPGTVTALTTLQYVAGAAGLLLLKRSKPLAAGAGVVFGLDFLRHPKYTLEKSGDYVVKIVA